ncbi:sulfotransferase 1C4-like [Aphomia sociella]
MSTGYIEVGPSRYFFPEGFKEDCEKIYNTEIRSSDVFVVTFPKSGTTWTQELVWLIGNNHDYETAAKVPLPYRFPFIEFPMFFQTPKVKNWLKVREEKDPRVKRIVEEVTKLLQGICTAPSPRYIKSHLPFSLLPPSLLDTSKVIYVARDPRDVAVSYYHHYKMMLMYEFEGDFKTFWNLFITNKVDWAPYGDHIREAWEKRHHPNLLFLFYEELSKDLPAIVRRVAQFLNKPVTEEQVVRLCDHLHIDNFKRNPSVNFDELKVFGMLDRTQHFVRKGKVGGWRAYFDDEMTQQAERWMADSLQGMDIQFPDISK